MAKQKIIIVGADFGWEEQALINASENAEFISLAELEINFGEKARFLRLGKDIFDQFEGNEKFIIRRSRGHFEKLVALVEVLGDRGFIFTDSFRAVAMNLNKELFLPTVESKIFPHPAGSFIANKGVELINKSLEFPQISKPVTGRHGEGIKIHQDLKSLQKEIDSSGENLLVQKFLEIESEYRIFVVGDKALGAVEKKAAPGKQIANYAAGASFTEVQLSQEFLEEAVRLCKKEQIEIGGVDVAKTTGNTYHILEINRCPEFKAFSRATGIDVAGKIIEFIENKK